LGLAGERIFLKLNDLWKYKGYENVSSENNDKGRVIYNA
jgi:hypothetical protein